MPDMQKLSELQLPDGSEYYIQDDSAIASISRSGNLFTATKRNGDIFTFTQHDITISSNPSNPNIITITDNDGNTYDVNIVISDATQSASGLMSATDKTKLDGVASGAEVNQFAFSAVEVTQGQTVTTLSADSKTDTLSIVAGDNITLTPTAVSDRVVFSAKDTTYTLIQDSTDKHKFTLHDSDGNDTTITIPDNDTTYTLSADPATGKIVLTPSSGSPISITVPNATHADSATADEDGDDIRATYATSFGQNPSDGHVLQLKDKNGNVLSTATVPDNNTTYTFENGTNGFSVTPSGGSKQTVTVTPSIANATQSKSGLMSANDKKKLDGVEAGADVNVIESVKVNGTELTPDANKAVNVTVPTKTSDLTNDSDYVSDASYVHTDNNYTSTEKSKLTGIASGAEVNQNAFSNVKIGTTTIAADGKTDTLELSAGSNISLTPDATNDKVTIAVTGLGTAAAQNFTTSVTSGSGDLVTSGAVASAISSAIDDLPEPMIFQGTLGTGGTITTLPTASNSNIGYTYKVITAGTYGGVASKVGDTFVSTELPKGSGTYTWVHIPSGDDIEDTWRNIKINGTEKLGTGISSGAVDFVNGNATTVSFNATGNKVSISHADTSSQASVNNSGRTYVQDITLDEYGHVTGIASATETVTNTDRYVNSASFADDTTASANSPVKMTLTRAGSDTVSVTANIPKVSSSSAGVAPKGSAVSSQSQSTKFLREDGSWAAPTYTVNTDTKVTAVGNHYTPTENTGSQLDADASSTTAATWNSTSLVTGVTIKRDTKGHVTGLAVDSIKMPANPNTNTTYTFAEGSTNGAFSVTPSGGSAQSVPVHGLKSAAYTESSAYATSGHTHTTSIATSTGTNQITLSHGGKYAITAGGTSYIFTMPSDSNTDTLVTQTATTTNATYEVLFSATADNTTRTETARKNSNLKFNPSTGTLSTTNVSASSAIATNDLDTNYLTTGSASITEANVGDLIVTGAARFLNTINGSISGNAATATLAADSSKLNGYASDTSATNNTIARRTANGYIFATYFNQSSGAETPTSSSYIIYANSDGYFRKSTVGNMKTAMSLNNVENKSSATIRGELTSANVTTALGYTPVNKAGDTMSGSLHFTSSAPLVYDWVHTTESPMIVLKDSVNYGIRYKEGDPDTMKFSASGNANTNNADLCINGAGDGTVTIRGNTIIHSGNYTSYTVKKDGTGASGTWGISISGNAATATTASSANSVAWGNVSGRPTKLSQFTNDITFATSIASSTDTSEITLAHNGVYTLTAGGTSFVFKMPSSGNTDTKVRQTLVTNTDNTNRPLLLAYSNTSTTTGNVDNISYRANTIYANASTGTITATKFVGDLDGNATTATNASKVNNLTVQTAVPANAKFTDTTYNISASGESVVLTGSNSSSSNVSLRTLCPPIHPKKFMFNTGIPANGTWCKLFSANYTRYNFLHIDLMTYHGYSGVYRTHLTIRFTASGFDATASNVIFYENITNDFVVTKDNDSTFSVWIRSNGTNSRVGYEILGIADESKVFYKESDNTFTAARWSFPTTFDTTTTAPTMAITNVRRFVLNTELGTNAYSSTAYLPLAGGTMTGNIVLPSDAIGLNFRNNANYYTTTSYQTAGNEALVFATKNAVTSFMFINGEDSVTNHSNNRWQSLTPALQIKQNSVYIGSLITNGTTPSYKFLVNGTSYLGGQTIITGTASSNPLIVRGITGSDGTGNTGDLYIQHNGGTTYFGTGDVSISADGSEYAGNAATATIATKLGTSTVGGTTTPIYLNAGVPTALSYTIAKSVPSNAVFTDTDTKNTAGSTDTSSKIFLIGATSQAANPQTYSDNQCYVTSGTLTTANTVATIFGVSASDGTSGGISLYSGTGNTDSYGIMFRKTTNKEKHGYVQSDWATYFTMNSGATTRGWIYRLNQTNGNVASISGAGNLVLNGSVTIGGNEANTSGVRQVYNATTQSLDFVFVA